MSGLVMLVAVVALPLIGAMLSGRDLGHLFQFPPALEIPLGYPRFSWIAAGAVLVGLAALAGSWVVGMRRPARPTTSGALCCSNSRRFPRWGVVAVVWTLSWWVLAWTRCGWFEEVQRFTFFPLWLGFIVTVNAGTYARVGTCLMRRTPARWYALFAVSALFWWIFEWLNRFVRNWHYVGVEGFDAVIYALHATVCFSTVLPAVAAVAEWFSTCEGWRRRTENGPAWPWLGGRGAAWMLAIGGAASLVLTGMFPVSFYPAVWVAPLALALSLSVFSGRRSMAHEVSRGDWSSAATWMAASLVCGFFWEMWNWLSVAKWIYTVPGVQRWHVFEMPLLGYAGYLPFGLECLLVAECVIGVSWNTRRQAEDAISLRKG